MGSIGLAVLLLLGRANGAQVELALYAPNGVPAPGDVAQLVVVAHRDGEAVTEPRPTLSVDGQPLAQEARAIGDGRWGFTLPSAGRSARKIEARLGEARIERTLGPASLPAARLRVPSLQEGTVGQALAFIVEAGRGSPPLPEHLAVMGVDGHLLDVQAREEGGLLVRWEPGNSPFPRTIALGVMDLRAPRVPPAWIVASLRGRPKIPIRTEPGAKVTVMVGGRTSETLIADDAGMVSVRPEIRPGETRAVVVTEDALGNTQQSEIALGGDSRPVLTVLSSGAIVPGRPMPHVHVHASQASGKPWTGDAPTCATTQGGTLHLAELGPGRWRGQLPPELGALDVRVQCDLDGRVQTRTQVRIEADLPTRLTLRSHPSEVSTDLPSAEIQAFLENALGDRLPSRDIQLAAARGTIRTTGDDDPALIRAVYRGDRAVQAGTDMIRAGVALTPGSGGVWSLDLAAAAPQGRQTILVDGRALDRHGRPLAGVDISFRIAAGGTHEGTTGERGWASIETPWPRKRDVVVVEVAAGGMVRRVAVLPGDLVARDISGPDLTASLEIPIRPGRINGIVLTGTPRVIESGGNTAQLEVRLEDRAGKAVPDQDVLLTTNVGGIGPAKRREDGTLVATYAPPVELLNGDVRIQARTPDGRFSATMDLSIIPRRLRQSIGVMGGVLAAPGSPLTPYGAMEYDRRMPWAPFVFRVSVGYSERHAVDEDAISGGSAEIDLRTVPIGLGLLAREDGQKVPVWLGGSIVGAVQRVSSRLGGVVVGEGLQVAPPGFRVEGGAGWRLRSGEIQAQLGYLFVYGQTGPIAWAGPVGGVVGSLGYKVLY